MSKQKGRLLNQYVEKFGLTMDLVQIAEVFHISRSSLYNLISSEKIPFNTFQLRKLGGSKGRVLVHTSDVVRYIEAQNVSD